MVRQSTILALSALTVVYGALGAPVIQTDGWTEAVEVRHDEKLCLSYRAKLDGPYLLVRAVIEPGWHTFAMDNKVRAEEKLAGKKALGMDQPTRFSVSGALSPEGPWRQTSPKDFSKPELRWFSWGFEREALFVAKVRHTGAGEAQIAVRGQACSDTTCRNIDVKFALPVGKVTSAPAVDVRDAVKELIEVRQ